MQVFQRVASLAVVAVLGVAILGAATPVQADTRKPTPPPTVQVVSPAPAVTVMEDEFIPLTIRGVAASSRITVDWGDGKETTQVAGFCTAKKAARNPAACTNEEGYDGKTYTSPGTFTVIVQQRGKPVYSSTVTVQPWRPAVANTNWRAEMLSQVNKVRADAGVAPLTECPALDLAAERHSQDMADRSYYEHYSPEGSTPGSRAQAAGWGSPYVGENIYASPRDVTSAMAGWIASPGHYSNLVNPDYEYIGLGLGWNKNSQWSIYWTQDFSYGGVPCT